MSKTYNRLLKFLYFEGYADSYEEAEYLLEEMSDEEFGEIEGLSRLPKGSLEEVVSSGYLDRSARAAMERAQQRQQQEAEMRKQRSSEARATQTRSGDIITIQGTSKGEPVTIVYNKKTGKRTIIPRKT